MKRGDYYYMDDEQRREYHRQKDQEYRNRKAELRGRPLRHIDPNSHPSLMTPEERRAYTRECQQRYKLRHQLLKQ